jgi:alkylhydroperoxidase family enzyme
LTQLEHQGVTDHAYAAVLQQFSESEVVFLTLAIAAINSWNRIGAALRFSAS